MTTRLMNVGVACVAAFFTALADAADVPKAKHAALNRPALEIHQGQYFRWAVPKGWRMNETANGVDLTAPDGKTFVSSALLVGGFGRMTPQNFLRATLQQLYASAQIESARPLPNQPGISGPWKLEEFAISGNFKGAPVRAHATVGISEGYGRYSATMTLYQAPVAQWEHTKTWLPAIAQSISVTNPRQLAGQDKVMLPRNNPLDNSGLIESWRQKGMSEDRISQARREATMGYERAEDPHTGRRYNVPYEAYDAGAGGYRNPTRPTELLRKLPPGE